MTIVICPREAADMMLGRAARAGGSARSHRGSRTRFLCGVAAVAVAALLAACGGGSGGSSNSSSSSKPQSVTMRINGDYPCLDPYGMDCGGLITQQIFDATYDHLVEIGPGGKLVPYLASSWTTTPTSVTFKIKSGVTCSDGAKLTATDIASAINSFFSRSAAEGGDLEGDWGPGPYTAAADSAAQTVTFTLGSPYPTAVYRFAVLPIVCPAGIASSPKATAPLTEFNSTSEGSGPYTMVSATHGQKIVLKLRKGWTWGPPGVTAADLPAALTLREVADETTAANLLTTNGLNVASVEGTNISRLISDKSLSVFSAESYTSYVIAFNETPGHPTDDKSVRKAIALAISPSAYGAAAFGTAFKVATDVLSPQADCYQNNSATIAKQNLSQAKAVLTADGYTKGSGGIFEKNGKPLTIALDSTTAGINQAGDYVVAALTQLGVKVNSTIGDYNTFLQKAEAGQFDVSTDTLPAQLPTPNFYAHVLIGTNNFDHTVDPQALADYGTAVKQSGCTAWQKFYADEISNYDLIPAVYPTTYWFTTNGIKVLPGPNLIEQQYIKS
jgi:peptide/nickel transport system substrate-binding protein